MAHRDGAPTPDAVARRAARIHAMLNRAVDDYRWAYHYAYGPARSSSDVPIICGPGDPTGRVALDGDRRGARSALRIIAKRLTEVERVVDASVVILERAFGRFEFSPHGGGQSLSRGELSALAAAKRRREERGEAWGDG